MSDTTETLIDYPIKVNIGDQTYNITRFRGMKASLAGALISRTMQEQPRLQELAANFRKDFREKNTVVITQAMSRLPRFKVLGFTDEDFASSGGSIEIPEEPDNQTIALNMFPHVFEVADRELRKLFALIVIPNSDLAEADDGDKVEEVLTRWGKKLMQEGDLDELLELLVISLDVLREQMLRKGGSLGKLPLPPAWKQFLLGTNPPGEKVETSGPGEEPQIPIEIPPSPTLNSTSDSSIDSDTNTDGPAETSSTESPGMN